MNDADRDTVISRATDIQAIAAADLVNSGENETVTRIRNKSRSIIKLARGTAGGPDMTPAMVPEHLRERFNPEWWNDAIVGEGRNGKPERKPDKFGRFYTDEKTLDCTIAKIGIGQKGVIGGHHRNLIIGEVYEGDATMVPETLIDATIIGPSIENPALLTHTDGGIQCYAEGDLPDALWWNVQAANPANASQVMFHRIGGEQHVFMYGGKFHINPAAAVFSLHQVSSRLHGEIVGTHFSGRKLLLRLDDPKASGFRGSTIMFRRAMFDIRPVVMTFDGTKDVTLDWSEVADRFDDDCVFLDQ